MTYIRRQYFSSQVSGCWQGEVEEKTQTFFTELPGKLLLWPPSRRSGMEHRRPLLGVGAEPPWALVVGGLCAICVHSCAGGRVV